ncbi:MAG: hypothetical protein ACI9RU_001025 [Litorivivens sp.]|jgi:hypothetical protein
MSEIICWVAGFGLFTILFVGDKLHRKKRNYWIAFFVSLAIATVGFYDYPQAVTNLFAL